MRTLHSLLFVVRKEQGPVTDGTGRRPKGLDLILIRRTRILWKTPWRQDPDTTQPVVVVRTKHVQIDVGPTLRKTQRTDGISQRSGRAQSGEVFNLIFIFPPLSFPWIFSLKVFKPLSVTYFPPPTLTYSFLSNKDRYLPFFQDPSYRSLSITKLLRSKRFWESSFLSFRFERGPGFMFTPLHIGTVLGWEKDRYKCI